MLSIFTIFLKSCLFSIIRWSATTTAEKTSLSKWNVSRSSWVCFSGKRGFIIHIPILCYFHEFFNNIFYHQGFASQNPMTQQRSGVSGLSGFSQTMSQTMDFSQDMQSGMRGESFLFTNNCILIQLFVYFFLKTFP